MPGRGSHMPQVAGLFVEEHRQLPTETGQAETKRAATHQDRPHIGTRAVDRGMRDHLGVIARRGLPVERLRVALEHPAHQHRAAARYPNRKAGVRFDDLVRQALAQIQPLLPYDRIHEPPPYTS